MPAKPHSARALALKILREHSSGGAYIEDILEERLSNFRLPGVERRLCQELTYGVIRWQATLDWLIARKSRRRNPDPEISNSPSSPTGHRSRVQDRSSPPHDPSPIIQNILRLGLYQIFWLERIPAHAAVHETVELAKRSGLHTQASFVNAVLRGYLREADSTRSLLAKLKTERPALGYSHPAWMVERWQRSWGSEKTVRLMEWNNTPARLFARVNLLKTDAGKLLALWRDEGVEYDFVRGDWIEENLVFELKSLPGKLSALPSFQQGCFYVQDPSTLLAVQVLDPKAGERVLDLCAAPGGKLTYAAQLMQNQGRIVARDIAADRLPLVAENCSRLGVTCVEIPEPQREPSPLAQTAIPFDAILVDAPCSNTGVMRRRLDLRWRLQPAEIGRLRLLQLELLRQAAGVLRPGGRLVYSTCSLEPEENRSVVDEFLGTAPEFRLELERELLPFRDNVDGAYVARLRR